MTISNGNSCVVNTDSSSRLKVGDWSDPIDLRSYGNLSFKFSSWGYSSGAEHSTADREVTGSNPVVP